MSKRYFRIGFDTWSDTEFFTKDDVNIHPSIIEVNGTVKRSQKYQKKIVKNITITKFVRDLKTEEEFYVDVVEEIECDFDIASEIKKLSSDNIRFELEFEDEEIYSGYIIYGGTFNVIEIDSDYILDNFDHSFEIYRSVDFDEFDRPILELSFTSKEDALEFLDKLK